MYIIYHIICLSRHYLLNNHSLGDHAQNKILPWYHAALHFLENLPENLMGGLAAPSLNRGQLLIIPGQKENLMTRVGEDFFTLQWVCGGLVYPGAFEHSGLGKLLAEMLRPGCPK